MRMEKLASLALLLVAFVAVALLSVIHVAPVNRTYLIGWEVDPPDQVATKSGEPTGFAVELVREAARRRGIRPGGVFCAGASGWLGLGRGAGRGLSGCCCVSGYTEDAVGDGRKEVH